MIDQELLDILVCPETHQRLTVADPETLESLNAAIARGDVLNRGGKVVDASVSEGLLRDDGEVLYVVRDDIPIMLIDESIAVGPSGPQEGVPDSTEETG